MASDDSLRAQNEALNEQVKLLVKTEQRLHRSQNEVDRQIARVELLNAFTLRWTGRATAADILFDASELLRKLVHVDGVRAVPRVPGPTPPSTEDAGLTRSRATYTNRPERVLWDRNGVVVTKKTELSLDLQESASTASCGADDAAVPDVASIVILPVSVNDSPPRMFLAASGTPRPRASHMREAPRNVTCLFLAPCRHLEHMLRNTRALGRPRLVRSGGYSAARDELEARVATERESCAWKSASAGGRSSN